MTGTRAVGFVLGWTMEEHQPHSYSRTLLIFRLRWAYHRTTHAYVGPLGIGGQ